LLSSSSIKMTVRTDLSAKAFGDSFKGIPSGNGGILCTSGGENEVLISSGNILYRYDLSTGTCEELLNWINCDINSDQVRQFAMLEDGRITDFKGTYQEYLSAKEKGKRSAGGDSSGAPSSSGGIAPEKKERPKRPGGTKNLEKEVNAAERAVAAAEERMYDLEQEIEMASADYLKLQELYQQREALEDELAHLYAVWERLAADLEEARG